MSGLRTENRRPSTDTARPASNMAQISSKKGGVHQLIYISASPQHRVIFMNYDPGSGIAKNGHRVFVFCWGVLSVPFAIVQHDRWRRPKRYSKQLSTRVAGLERYVGDFQYRCGVYVCKNSVGYFFPFRLYLLGRFLCPLLSRHSLAVYNTVGSIVLYAAI